MSDGPSPFFGILYRDWRKLRRRVGPLAPDQGRRVAHIVLRGLLNEAIHFEEERQFGELIDRQVVAPPVIVLGLARSGTTFLHNLLAQDPRFAFPRASQSYNPHTFLVREGVARGALAYGLRGLNFLWSSLVFGKPAVHSRRFDNVKISMRTPAEDEQALQMSGHGPSMVFLFPNAGELFLRTDAEAREEFQRLWLRFLKKLSFLHQGKPLMLKSPTHMARISAILELLPQARFVFISRHPHDIYSSSLRLGNVMVNEFGFQIPPRTGGLEYLLQVTRATVEAYLRERALIPSGQLHELRYEDLVRDPEGELERMYRNLSLPDFEGARPSVRAALAELADYKVNAHAELDADIAVAVRREWTDYFQAFGYE